MTEEQEQVAQQETPPEENTGEPNQQQEQQPNQQQEQQPDGKQFIDLETLAPAVKARFERIYGHMKENERAVAESAKVNRALIERLEKLENSEIQQQITSLEARQKEAFESGDYDKAQEYANQLIDYKLAEKSRPETKIEVPEPHATDQPLNDDQMDLLASWARATDADGNPLRPWAHPQHQDHQKAIRYIQAAAVDPDYDIESAEGFKALLQSVDQRMTGRRQQPQQQSRVAAVLSGNGDGRPRTSEKTPRLTPEEQRVAEGMGYTPKQYAEIKAKYGVK